MRSSLPLRLIPALVLLAPWVPAEEPAAQAIGPAEVVSIALEHHPLLQGAEEEVRAAEADRALARSGYLPRLHLDEQLARSTNPVFVFASKLGQERFGAADFDVATLNAPDPLTNAATRLVLEQNVWDAGRTRLGQRAAAVGIDAAEQALQRTEDEIGFGALKAFWDLDVADAMLDVARDAEAAARANVALASELVDAGLAVPSDRMSAEVRLAETEALRIRAEQGRAVAHAALLTAMGLAAGGPFDPEPPRVVADAAVDDLEQRIVEALDARADLRSLEHRIRQAELGVRMARSHRLPEIGAGARYEWNGDTLLGSDGSNWTVGVGVTLPLFDGTETHARVARARADLARLEAIRQALRHGVQLDVRAAWAERESARRRLEVASAALEAADEALRIVRERYGAGLTVIVELLGAEAAQTQARATHAAANGDLWLARARLDLATGRRPWGHVTTSGGAPQTGEPTDVDSNPDSR